MYTRIAIIGAGPMGTSLAALTSSKIPTVVVVRDRWRAEQIRESGIRVTGLLEAFGRPDVVASIDDLATIDSIDLLFIATKTTAISEICRSLRSHVAWLPHVVSYQNGIEPGRTLIKELGTPRVVRMICTYGAAFEDTLEDPAQPRDACSRPPRSPLSVRIALHAPPHFVGGEGAACSVARELARQLSQLGLPTEFTSDIDREAWRKGIANAAGNPVAAILRAPLGEILGSPAEGLVRRLLAEGLAVARAAGIALDDSFVEAALAPMSGGGSHLPSMAADIIAGRRTEIAQLNEEIVARGNQLGVATPSHAAVIDLIHALENRSSGGDPNTGATASQQKR